MKYRILFRKRATKEYLQSIAWYKERSDKAAKGFVLAMNAVLDKLETEPGNFRNTYKHFKEVAVKRYPFFVVYFIDTQNEAVVITSVYHFKRNPKKKY
jgi:toxin ParE1/3/4